MFSLWRNDFRFCGLVDALLEVIRLLLDHLALINLQKINNKDVTILFKEKNSFRAKSASFENSRDPL